HRGGEGHRERVLQIGARSLLQFAANGERLPDDFLRVLAERRGARVVRYGGNCGQSDRGYERWFHGHRKRNATAPHFQRTNCDGFHHRGTESTEIEVLFFSVSSVLLTNGFVSWREDFHRSNTDRITTERTESLPDLNMRNACAT